MTLDELITWLEEHVQSIFRFTDYEVTRESEAELADILGTYWFRAPDTWNQPGYRFVHLGHDGTGGHVAAWIRPGAEEPPPVVFFGSEGGRGVLALTPQRFASALAHGAMIVEYPGLGDDDDDAPARLEPDSWMLDPDEVDAEAASEASAALDAYRSAHDARFGPPAPLEDLTAGLDALNAEFCGWVRGVTSG